MRAAATADHVDRPSHQNIPVPPETSPAKERAALLRLLQLEADLRRVPSERELIYHLANESRAVLGFRQAFVLRLRRRWTLQAVSSVAGFDHHAPINRQVVALIAGLPAGAEALCLDLQTQDSAPALAAQPFRHGLWIPLRARNGRVFAGVLMLRERPWHADQLPLAQRLAGAYGHGWQALIGRATERRGWPASRLLLPALVVALGLAGLIRAPLTVLAPTEVTGQQQVAVTAPLTGVLKDVLVAPNDTVSAGRVLARYDSSELKNALDIADKKVAVARTELAKLQNAAFDDPAEGRDTKIAEAELDLALAELALAEDRLARAEIRAVTPGIAVFEDARDLTGRPVSPGEKLMEIITPGDTEFTIRLPVADSIVLAEGGKVRVFLDSRPLAPITGRVLRSSYRATMHADGSFGYTLIARAAPKDMADLRIGAHGTAQVFGAHHSLLFIALRRPLSWLRQTFGY